jgi:hypothetical protein
VGARWVRRSAALPFVLAAIDYGEDALQVAAVLSYPAASAAPGGAAASPRWAALVRAASAVNRFKWRAVAVVASILLLAAVAAGYGAAVAAAVCFSALARIEGRIKAAALAAGYTVRRAPRAAARSPAALARQRARIACASETAAQARDPLQAPLSSSGAPPAPPLCPPARRATPRPWTRGLGIPRTPPRPRCRRGAGGGGGCTFATRRWTAPSSRLTLQSWRPWRNGARPL